VPRGTATAEPGAPSRAPAGTAGQDGRRGRDRVGRRGRGLRVLRRRAGEPGAPFEGTGRNGGPGRPPRARRTWPSGGTSSRRSRARSRRTWRTRPRGCKRDHHHRDHDFFFAGQRDHRRDGLVSVGRVGRGIFSSSKGGKEGSYREEVQWSINTCLFIQVGRLSRQSVPQLQKLDPSIKIRKSYRLRASSSSPSKLPNFGFGRCCPWTCPWTTEKNADAVGGAPRLPSPRALRFIATAGTCTSRTPRRQPDAVEPERDPRRRARRPRPPRGTRCRGTRAGPPTPRIPMPWNFLPVPPSVRGPIILLVSFRHPGSKTCSRSASDGWRASLSCNPAPGAHINNVCVDEVAPDRCRRSSSVAIRCFFAKYVHNAVNGNDSQCHDDNQRERHRK
jgi:hypothetical protein